MSNLMTETEVAKRLNVSLPSIRRWQLERRGPAFVKVVALVQYRPEDLDAWLSKLPTGGSIKAAQRARYALCARTRKGLFASGRRLINLLRQFHNLRFPDA